MPEKKSILKKIDVGFDDSGLQTSANSLTIQEAKYLNETQISKILGHVDTRMVGQVYLRKIQDDTLLKAADKIEQGMKERLAV